MINTSHMMLSNACPEKVCKPCTSRYILRIQGVRTGDISKSVVRLSSCSLRGGGALPSVGREEKKKWHFPGFYYVLKFLVSRLSASKDATSEKVFYLEKFISQR